jgi:hypothetical protein
MQTTDMKTKESRTLLTPKPKNRQELRVIQSITAPIGEKRTADPLDGRARTHANRGRPFRRFSAVVIPVRYPARIKTVV